MLGIIVFQIPKSTWSYVHSVRSISMGGAGVAFPELVDAVFLNGSALPWSKDRFQMQTRYLTWYFQEELAATMAYSKGNFGIGLGGVGTAPWRSTVSYGSSYSSTSNQYSAVGAVGYKLNSKLSVGITPKINQSSVSSSSYSYSQSASSLDVNATLGLGNDTRFAVVVTDPQNITSGKIQVTGGIGQNFGRVLTNATDVEFYYDSSYGSLSPSSLKASLSTGFELRTANWLYVLFGYKDTMAPAGSYSSSSVSRYRFIFLGNTLNLGKRWRIDVLNNVYQVSSGSGASGYSGPGSSDSFIDNISVAITAKF